MWLWIVSEVCLNLFRRQESATNDVKFLSVNNDHFASISLAYTLIMIASEHPMLFSWNAIGLSFGDGTIPPFYSGHESGSQASMKIREG